MPLAAAGVPVPSCQLEPRPAAQHRAARAPAAAWMRSGSCCSSGRGSRRSGRQCWQSCCRCAACRLQLPPLPGPLPCLGCILPSATSTWTSPMTPRALPACARLPRCRCCLPSGSRAAPPSEQWQCCSGSQGCGGTSLACWRQPARRARRACPPCGAAKPPRPLRQPPGQTRSPRRRLWRLRRAHCRLWQQSATPGRPLAPAQHPACPLSWRPSCTSCLRAGAAAPGAVRPAAAHRGPAGWRAAGSSGRRAAAAGRRAVR